MRFNALRATLVLSLAAAPLVFASTVASAADSTVGEEFTPSGSDCGGPYTLLQTGSSGPSYSIPANGIITKVRIPGTSVDSTRALKVARPSGGNYTVFGGTTPTLIHANDTLVQGARIPVQAGDIIGLYFAENSICGMSTNSMADTLVGQPGEAAIGDVPASHNTNYRVSIAVTVEPDADGDGYGDTTQDQCPTLASTQGPCPGTTTTPTPGNSTFSLGSVGAPTGIAKVGKKLAAPSLTVPAGATKSYQWYRVFTVKSHGHSHIVKQRIYGATGAKYKLKSKDKGKRVYVQIRVTAPKYDPAAVKSRTRKVH